MRKILTQSNALPLIKLHGSCLAQGRCAPRKGLALPCVSAQMTESRSLHSIKHEPRQHLGCLCASSPYPQFHKASRAGYTSVSIQHLAQQSTKTDANIPSKSLFKVTHPRGCWLAEAGREEGSSTAEQLMLSQGHQHSFHLPMPRRMVLWTFLFGT